MMNDLVLQQAINRILVNQYNIMESMARELPLAEGKWLRESMSHTSRIRNAVLTDDPSEASKIGAA